ncbi:type III pantothenate kinase [Cupriavidus gilardii J11]|uniref:Type III pantothenate kinase n=1 Tax=Cupriavidus gilardii J11 TaxID=936133 RepID=A0A562BJX4_9BURK|nr:type III pantothenate kinase [Cupriavidus gilardii]TWG85273.1 type III pantothenate kinase [Cupriavidus gilardii J11]
MNDTPALLIDIGNTRIKWAWCHSSPLSRSRDSGHPSSPLSRLRERGRGRGESQPHPTPEQNPSDPLPTPWQTSGAQPHANLATLAQTWRTLASAGPAPAVWISNVAGPTMAAALDAALAEAFDGPPATVNWWRSTPNQGLLHNGYREPIQLGVDRWLGAIGARYAIPDGNLLIVTAGTATTIDVVTAPEDHDPAGKSRFEGGLILPGLSLMMGSLARNTAQLPALELTDAAGAPPWADNTRDAIAAGCLAAQTGAIERAWRALSSRGPVHGLLSGGAQQALANALTLPVARHENLVLLGLWVVAAETAVG